MVLTIKRVGWTIYQQIGVNSVNYEKNVWLSVEKAGVTLKKSLPAIKNLLLINFTVQNGWPSKIKDGVKPAKIKVRNLPFVPWWNAMYLNPFILWPPISGVFILEGFILGWDYSGALTS